MLSIQTIQRKAKRGQSSRRPRIGVRIPLPRQTGGAHKPKNHHITMKNIERNADAIREAFEEEDDDV